MRSSASRTKLAHLLTRTLDMSMSSLAESLLLNGREELQLLYGRRIDGDLSPTKWNAGLHIQLPRGVRLEYWRS